MKKIGLLIVLGMLFLVWNASAQMMGNYGMGMKNHTYKHLRIADTNHDGVVSDAEREAFLKKYDTNGDGKLSREERMKARFDKRKTRPGFIKRFDTNKDGVLSADELKAAEEKISEMRKKYDTNGDGKLSKEERQKMRMDRRKARFKMMCQKHRWMRKLVDTNGDGTISDAELDAAIKKREELKKKFDKNGDGKLSKEERKELRLYLRKEFLSKNPKILKKFDKNGNGIIDDDEFAAMKKAREEMKKKMDTNGDGKISLEERKNFFLQKAFQRPGIIRRFDKNGNGVIDGDEKTAVEQFLQQRREKRKAHWNNSGYHKGWW